MKPSSPWLTLLTALLLTLSTALPARADIFRLTYDESAVDPADGFDEACLGESPAEDCDVRAAIIEGELVALLSRLESDRDPATLALFQAALELESPVVRAMAARYLSRVQDRPSDLLSKVKTFFWGPDAPLGVAAAEVLDTSPEEADQQLAELYREQRPRSDYEPAPIFSEEDEPPSEEDRLALACSQDTRLELMQSFAEEEVFSPARRLLMYDRFVQSLTQPDVNYAVTAFVTDASVEEVTEFFRPRFGEPLGPFGSSAERIQELTERLFELQEAAASGDQAAIAEIQRIVEEVEELQEQVALASYLQLPLLHPESDLVFIDGTPEEAIERPLRAITFGTDAVAGGTVIRYLNAPNATASGEPGEGDGGSGPGDEDLGEAGATGRPPPLGEAGAAGRPSQSSDGGCGCSVPGHSPRAGAWVGIALALGLLRRRGRLGPTGTS